MKQILNSKKGYTLVELLAVIVVLGSVGVIITSILVSVLRGGNRSTTSNDIRQNGSYAISQMAKMISYAQKFNGVSSDNVNYVSNCVLPTFPTPTPTPAPYKYISISSFDGGTTVFSCNGATDNPANTIASNGAAMLNSNVSLSNCSFTCTQDNLSSPPTIIINFSLSKTGTVLFVENNVSIPFQTSVTLRNY